jgi:hypothetical protein
MNRLFPFLILVFVTACRPSGDEPPTAAAPLPAALETPAAEPPPYSTAAGEIVRMVHAGLPEATIRNQILLRRTPCNISPDELIRMNRDGVPQSLLAVVQQRDAQLAALEQSQHDNQLRRELQTAIATLRKEIRSNQTPAKVTAPAPAPQIIVQQPTQVRETIREQTIIREQVPYYVGYPFNPGRRPPPQSTPARPASPYSSGTPIFVPPRQGDAGFSAPVTGFAAPVSSPAPPAMTNGQRLAWRYYTGPGN